jgi:hypothetical protein
MSKRLFSINQNLIGIVLSFMKTSEMNLIKKTRNNKINQLILRLQIK